MMSWGDQSHLQLEKLDLLSPGFGFRMELNPHLGKWVFKSALASAQFRSETALANTHSGRSEYALANTVSGLN